ncbi:MAG: hypothetical protein M3509_07015, partial [Chloroflexota bacterium]|nr:hypothetical protein [Chloroflexota bacterium]
FTILRIGLWDFAPWITVEYAAAVGLFARDNTRGAPIIPGMLPAYLLLAGIVVDLVLLAGRRFGWNVWLTVIAAGALTPAVIQLTEPVPALFTRLPALFPPLVPLARLGHISLVTIAIGAIGGVLGWIVGYVLRNQEQHPAPATMGLGVAQETA